MCIRDRSNTSYDPDRLAYDQQKLRLFYLTNGYADFRVISAVAELTSNKQDFIITYVVEEGERYKFSDVDVKSEIRDFQPDMLKKLLPMKSGAWYDAKQVEDTVESLSETAGLFGYAFADINPEFRRDPETKTMAVTFNVAESPRTYAVSYTHLRAHETVLDLVCRLLLEKKKNITQSAILSYTQ